MSLGYRRGHDHIAERAPPTIRVTAPTTPVVCEKTPWTAKCGFPVFRGYLPTLLYSSYFVLPLLYFYVLPDFDNDVTKGLTIGAAALAALIVTSNDARCWFNIILFQHIASRRQIVELAINHANASGRTDLEMGMAIPVRLSSFFTSSFLFTDRIMFLALLASAVSLNTATLVYTLPIPPSRDRRVSSIAPHRDPNDLWRVRGEDSMWNLLVMRCTGKWITCSRFEM